MLVKRNCFLFILIITLLCACSSNIPQTKEENVNLFYKFTDDLGNTVELKEKPNKVVALMSSYAELWLLSGGELAGVTEDAVSERNIAISESTQIIGSYKEPNIELILSISPDFVLLSTDIEQHVKLADTLKASNINHGYFKEDSYLDYLRLLKIFTDITEKQDLYEKYGITVEKQINDLLAKIPKDGEKPKVLLIRSMSTKAKALKDDHLVGIMLKDLGVDNIATRHSSLLEDLSIETIIDENPDYIFVITMGDIGKAMATLENGIMANPAWDNLDAIKSGNYHVLPKDLFQYKPNERWGESYEYLKKILYK